MIKPYKGGTPSYHSAAADLRPPQQTGNLSYKHLASERYQARALLVQASHTPAGTLSLPPPRHPRWFKRPILSHAPNHNRPIHSI